jgi:hypothetical protein
MSGWAVARRAVVLISIAFVSIGLARANDAADAIAERFAADAERAQARRQQADNKREVQNKKDSARKQEAPRKPRAEAQAAQEARRAAEQRRSDEADMLARARREAEEMRAREEQAQLAEEARRLIIEAERERVKAEELLARQRAEEEPAKPAPPSNADTQRREAAEAEARRAAQAAVEQERASAAEDEKLAQARREETRRIIEKLHRMRQIRDARLAAQASRALAEQVTTPPGGRGTAPASQQRAEAADAVARGAPPTDGALKMVPPPIQPPRAEAEARDPRQERSALGGDPLAARHARRSSDMRFTVLLILAPGTYGIRRNGPKVADPILCTLNGCYVSDGADRPASFMPGRKALSFGNTWGARAGACRQRLGCVFRAIELGELPGYLQPVDLHILRHDRRRGQVIAGDSACRADGGRLLCGRGVYADDYVLWIVPEHVAEAAGPAALERAVAEGLNGPRAVELSPQVGR